MKSLLLALAAVLLIAEDAHSLNEKQMVAAAKLIKNTCKTKTKISDEVIENMHKGIWDDNDEKAKCYYHCCLAMMKMQKKNGAFDLESAMKQLPTLPEPRQAACEASMKRCEHAGDEMTHKCDISYAWFKCMYFDNPDLTEAQIKQTGKLIRRSCVTKTQASEDELDGFRNGKFDGATDSGKCYLNCALQMIKMIKRNGHLDPEGVAKGIQTLPEPRREPNIITTEKCKDAGSQLTEKCEIAFEIAKCYYNSNPDEYIIP